MCIIADLQALSGLVCMSPVVLQSQTVQELQVSQENMHYGL